MPYRSRAQWTRLALRRSSPWWRAAFVLGAIASAVAVVAVVSALLSAGPHGASGWLGAALALGCPGALLALSVAMLAWMYRANVEIFREGIRVHARRSNEARWEQVTAFRRLVYRDVRGIAHEAGWALDVGDGRRLHIAASYGDLEPELARHLAPHGIYVTKTELEGLPPVDVM